MLKLSNKTNNKIVFFDSQLERKNEPWIILNELGTHKRARDEKDEKWKREAKSVNKE